jgi:hypothetical protein
MALYKFVQMVFHCFIIFFCALHKDVDVIDTPDTVSILSKSVANYRVHRVASERYYQPLLKFCLPHNGGETGFYDIFQLH